MEVWLTYCINLLYSPDLCHCIKAFSEGDHHTAVTLLPQLQRHNNILCEHPHYDYHTTYLVHRAIYNGWKDITELLITTYNCNSTQKDSEGWTALHHAACGGHTDIVRCLVENSNCDVNVKDNTGYTPLHHAAHEGHIGIVRYLVENCNCGVNVKDNAGYTPLHHAAHKGTTDIVRWLVENSNCDVNDVNIRESTGYTPLLHYAAREGHNDIVRCLVENSNCDVNVKDDTGYTPLYHAAREGHIDIVRWLVENSNCDVSVKDNAGYTPLHHAAHKGHTDIVRYLVENSSCDVNDVNIRESTGYTPLLHYAAREGHNDIVRCLVENSTSNCDVNVKDNTGYTPLHHAAHKGHTDIVRYLVENSNCDVNVKDNTGYTPLHYAAREGHIDIVRWLVENSNCDVNVKDSTGYTLLHHAAHKGHTDIVRYLVENNNCDVNVKDNSGYTPLHHAARERHIDIVRWLVENSNCDVDVNVKDNTGCTPLHHAAREGHMDTVKCLAEHTADIVMATDKYGATPFHLACQHNSYNRNIPVIKYFLSIPVVLESFTNKTSDYRSPLSGAKGNAATIFHQFERIHISHPVGSFINIFLLGHTGAGKTSLCHVLKERSSFFKIGKFVTGVKTLTAGIVPNKLRDKSLGNIIVHDFAGQPEYYSSHAAILESLLENCGAVFVVVINLTQDLSQQVRFWSGIVRNECQKAVSSECHLIVIASHADRAEFKQIELKAELTEAGYSDVPIFGLDCRLRSSDNLHSFVKDLSHLCTSIRNKQSPAISLYCNFLYSILEALKDNVCTLEKFLSLCEESRQKGVPLPDDIVPSLKTLHSSGLIVYLENKEDHMKSWVVVRKGILLSEVDGILFAPSYFKEHRNIASNTGIITSRALEVVFRNHDTNMLIAFLKSMKLCEELDKALLKVTNLTLRQEGSLHESDQLLFFPALIAEERPQHIKGHFKIGWCLKVTSKYSFSVRFLHVLLLHLAFQYSKAVRGKHKALVSSFFQRNCSVWKNGIHWHNDKGVETIVEQVDGNQCVMVLMSCEDEAEEDMIKLHCELIKTVTDLVKDYCPTIDCKDYLLDPRELQYPVDNPTSYDMEESVSFIHQDKKRISCCDGTDKPAIKIADLLPIEPKEYLRIYKVS